MTSQPQTEETAIFVLPNISRIKSSETMKFGQLIEYYMRSIFLKKPFTKCCGETIPKPFPKKTELRIFLDE